MSFLRNGAVKKVFFAMMIALFACALFFAATISPEAAHAEKETYVFDYSVFFYRRNADSVAFYYDGEFDPAIGLILYDEEGVHYPDVFGSTCVGEATLYLTRAADERYEAFTSEAIPLTVNTDKEVFILPIGQKRYYDGSTTADDLALFTQGGIPTEALHAGEYLLTLDYESPVVVPFYIEKAPVSATPNRYERRYLDPGQPSEIAVEGDLPDTEMEYIRNNLVLICSLQDDSTPGEYPITLVYNGATDDYDLQLNASVCVVRGAILTGFTFSDGAFLYDGKMHSLSVSYDHDRWTGVNVSYSLSGMADVGKYRVTATVQKEYYEDLILSATLTIRTDALVSSSSVDQVSVEGSVNGFDPTITVSLVAFSYDKEDEAIKSLQKEKDNARAVIVSAYSVEFSEAMAGKYLLKMKPSKPTNASGVTLMQYRSGEIVEVEYRYENGYFVVETDDYDGFLFVKKEHVTHSSVTDVVVAAIIGAVVVIVLLIIIGAMTGGSKGRRRSRRRHAKWA